MNYKITGIEVVRCINKNTNTYNLSSLMSLAYKVSRWSNLTWSECLKLVWSKVRSLMSQFRTAKDNQVKRVQGGDFKTDYKDNGEKYMLVN